HSLLSLLILLLFIMSPSLPLSTLFPYTTLFRSWTPRVFPAWCWWGRAPGALPPSCSSPAAPAWPPGCSPSAPAPATRPGRRAMRSEEHTSELQSRFDLVCRLLLEKKKSSFFFSL